MWNNDNGFIWIILIIILLGYCGSNNCGNGCGCNGNCGCNGSNNCTCGCSCCNS